MSKILAVFGATSQQGGSVVDFVLNDHELSKEYKIRAITRDVHSEKAKKLGERVEVVAGDTNDRASLEPALNGAHTVFAMTNPTFGPDGYETELNSAKAIADTAVATGAKYIIFSTLPSIQEISKGKYTKAVHFDAKAVAEQYIRSLPVKSAFFCPGGFMQNYNNFPFFKPQKIGDQWTISGHSPSTVRTPLINIEADTGKWIGAILAEPDKYEGKTFYAATALYSQEEIAKALSKSAGQTVVYKQLSLQEYKDQLPAFVAENFIEVLGFVDEHGYFGVDTEQSIKWAAENARGKLTTFEEYLAAHPMKLE